MARINELVKKRGTYKGRLTKFQTYVDSFEDVVRFSEIEILELKLRMTNIEAMFAEFEEVQTSIECLAVTEEDAEAYAGQRSDFESQYFAVLARAQEICSSYKTTKRSSKRNASDTSFSSANENDDIESVKQVNKGSAGVKLPTLQIPKYSGDFESWLEFRDVFSSLIHTNQAISDIQKFHYLRASLEGGAAQIIRALEFSASNYTLAWKSLCERYDNTRLLVHNHVKAIFDEEAIKRESASSIRRVLDACNKNLRALQILGEPTDSWDTLIIYIICTKLDARTLREWEQHKVTHEKLTLKIFTNFLKNRADVLETIELSNNINNNKHESMSKANNRHVRGLSTVVQPFYKKYKCPLCKAEHPLYLCDQFLQMGIGDREQFVGKTKLCNNCLRAGHHARVCRLGPCRQCGGKHNTLLHRVPSCTGGTTNVATSSISTSLAATTPIIDQSASDSTSDTIRNMSAIDKRSGRVLLATALIRILDIHNRPHEVKAILDSGSQASFMTESLLKSLGLNSQSTKSTVVGINNQVSAINKRCDAILQSRINSFTTNITLLVLPSITSTNNEVFNVSTLNIPSGIQLADPEYFNPSSYDILLGADIFWDLLCANKIKLGNNCPVLQETKFGYIVSGPTGQQTINKISCNFTKFDEIQDQLSKFWTIEEVPTIKEHTYTAEEELCEQHFIENMSRKEDGRFSVGIPLKNDESELGDSFERAKACFLALERRLEKQPAMKVMYVDFMKEYLSLGHMALSDINTPLDNSYYMPHHGVLRDQSTTTRLRVVFNASAPTSSGLSCNDLQMVGPTIQSDLFSILLRFRQHRYVMTGDIEKMYRQVLVNENQRHLQQIIWRDDSSKQLNTYALKTVTYGTASAAFLSIRCLKQIADECDNEQVRQVISEDFYVDDLLTGLESAESLMALRAQISNQLKLGCFNLRMFRSNLPTCSDELDDTNGSAIVNLSEHEQSKTLGLKWSPSDDVLQFDIKTDPSLNVTKRTILSTISQIFDPLGVLSIFIIVGKIILQKLWLHKLDWDSPLPQDIVKLWVNFVTELKHLQSLKIPRHVVCHNPVNIQLHVFCDSSKDAYGACAYIRSADSHGNTRVRLLCSKTRVAPIKALSIPRLELCGALVAARLLEKILQTTRLPVNSCFLWTDSSVVLGWLKTPPNKLKPFVKNRVADIQEITKSHFWRHVPTAANPADLLSRGVTSAQPDKLDIWFNGPKFLLDHEESWPNKTFDNSHSELPEVRSNVAATNSDPIELFPFSRFSNLSKLKNTMAYVLHLIANCKNKTNKIKGAFSLSEKQSALDSLVKLSQRESFDEYETLAKGKSLSTKNKLLSLTPFIDERGLMRVGGRIKNGNFTFAKKHPILLTSKHALTKLIFRSEHLRLMHAGPQLLLSSIREEFWALGGRNLSRYTVHKCQRCFRLNAQTTRPIMGNLPEQRLQPGYPFHTTGMDYAGPLLALNKRGRGSKTEKVYIAIFICFATKCVHLELVSSLCKDSFLATLRRFIARRSKPATLFSDNGTQFVGAKNELYKFLNENAGSIIDEMTNQSIDFKFIPAYAAHMAGLWEANIKCLKSHLNRVLGNAHLVFEDLYTVLVQIEAILNSRPLTPLSTDPHDLTPLTPGHFLVGRPMTALPTPSLVDINQNRLTRFERLEQLRQHFWARRHKEYIAELQQRTKWRTSRGPQLQKGALVLIKDEGLPPMQWRLGRIVETYPGTDGVTRVADIKTARGVIRRGFNRICPLPTTDDEGLKDKPFNAGGHVRDAPAPSPSAGPAAANAAQSDGLRH